MGKGAFRPSPVPRNTADLIPKIGVCYLFLNIGARLATKAAIPSF